MTRFVDFIDKVIGWITATILLITFCLLVFSVFARYVAVDLQIDWILEVVIFLVAWAVLLGVARIEKRSGHIRVDFVQNAFSDRGKRASEVVALLFALAVGLFYVWAGILVVQEAISWDERTDSTLRIPFWVYYLSLSTCFAIHALFITHRLASVLSGAPLTHGQDLAD
ncbi:MAG: hypothetical protein Tsb0019_00700 [Roseibium sp.]